MPTLDKSRVCFVISPIGATDSPERAAADSLLKYVIDPVAGESGLKVMRADKIDDPGTITRQIIEYLVESAVVVADMSGHNPNVFYELAVRHAAQKPIVHMIANGQTIPFDVAPQRAIFYTLDLPGAEDAKVKLKGVFDAIDSGDFDSSDSPLSNALERIALTRSGNPSDQRESKMLEAIQDIQLRMINMESHDMYSNRRRMIGAFEDYPLRMAIFLDWINGQVVVPDMRHRSVALMEELMALIEMAARQGAIGNEAISKIRHPSRAQVVNSFIEGKPIDREWIDRASRS